MVVAFGSMCVLCNSSLADKQDKATGRGRREQNIRPFQVAVGVLKSTDDGSMPSKVVMFGKRSGGPEVALLDSVATVQFEPLKSALLSVGD